MSSGIMGFCSDCDTKTSERFLRVARFSSPGARAEVKGVAFPWLLESTSTRRGLLDPGRFRGEERKGAERRSVKRFFVVVVVFAGVASGDSGIIAEGLLPWCALGLKARANAKGESGERGESELRSWKRDGFEGERESERRSCWIEDSSIR
jgi:hypothetical protein